MWPFKRKPPPADKRDWNEDWKVGDVAECIVDGINIHWNDSVLPWNRPAFRQRLIVVGFHEGPDLHGSPRYWLRFEDWPTAIATTGFRKVRPLAKEKSEVVERILKAKPGKDRVRETS